jgi:5'-3' exoribonuclease 1
LLSVLRFLCGHSPAAQHFFFVFGRNPWEGVNLLPFIDVQLLKDTIATHCPPSKLSPAELRRNAFGKVYCYRYDVTSNDTVDSPNRKIGLADIVNSQSSVIVVDEQATTGIPFKPVLLPGTRIPYPGFPSLNVLPFASVQLTKIGLNVFGTPSKYPTTVLTLHQMPELPPLEVLADTVLGKVRLYHLQEAQS